MRIKTVSIEGFGSFLEKQEIDFTKYNEEGLFIIVGETGSGKSTILDAITFALYGLTARWSDSGATKENQALRSHFAKGPEKSEVVLEFELGTRTFRVTRSPKYVREDTNKNVDEKVKIDEIFSDGSESTLANQKNLVGEMITGLLKMSATEFLQVILLAQGRFDKFLDADSKERMVLLSKIFYTSRFKQLETKLKEAKDAIQTELNSVKMKFEVTVSSLINLIGVEPPEFGQEISWVELIDDEYEGAISDALQAADEDLNKLEEAKNLKLTAERQKTFHEIKSELSKLTKETKQIETLKGKLERATKANKITATYQNRERLVEDEAELRKVVETTLSSAKDLELDVTKKGLESFLERMISDLKDLAVQEESLPSRRELVSDLDAKINANSERLNVLRDELKQSQTLVDELEQQEEEVGKAQELIRQKQPILDKAETLAESERDLVQEKANTIALREAKQKTANELNVALKAHDDELAVTLAKTLKAGEPCMVCGSTLHPKPHKSTNTNKTSKSLESYQSLAVKAAADLEANAALIKNLSGQVSRLKSILQDQDVKSIRKEVQLAEKIIEDWKSKFPKLKEARAQLGPASKFNLEIRQLTDAKPKMQSDLDSAKAEITSIEKNIANNLAGYDSISLRIPPEIEKLRILREYLEAKSNLENTMKTLKEFDTTVKALLKREGFSSEDEFRKSVLDDTTFKSSQLRVKKHDDDVIRLTSLQAQEVYQNLPSKIIDFELATELLRNSEEASKKSSEVLIELKTKSNAVKTAQEELNKLAPKMVELNEQIQIYEGLYNIVIGKSPNTLNMSLETFVLAAELETVVEAANTHLKKLSNEQYSFQHTDKAIRRSNSATGLELEIMDEHTGRARPTQGLSGGEEFLASISLAIGLAEVVTNRSGGISIDTLFIDEGFGSLSSDYLARAIDTLNSLKQGGRTIGVISHVDAMKEAIQAQIEVFKNPGGTSRVTQTT